MVNSINSAGDNNTQSTKSTPSSVDPKKDFQKVFAKEQRENKGKQQKKSVGKDGKNVKNSSFDDLTQTIEEQDAARPAKGVSLFDLVGGQDEEIEGVGSVTDSEEIALNELSDEIKQGSLSALFNGYGVKEKLENLQQEINANLNESSFGIFDINKQTSSKSDKEHSAAKFSQEQPDLASVNSMNKDQTTNPIETLNLHETQQTESKAAEMKEIVDQIISKLYTISTSGKTQTLITLNRPPLFAGASVVITSFNSAKGEFNITFENLTQAAKKILDMRENQNALKLALDQKGYKVHIVTTTTLKETVNLVEGKVERQDRKQEKNDTESEGNPRKKKQEEQEF